MMKEKLTEKQIQAILRALDEAIEKGPWNKSNFLRIAGKKLHQIRDDFATYIGKIQEQIKTESELGNRFLESEKLKVFISLYSSGGNNLQTWERVLANLPRQLISRGVYSKEEDLKNLIQSREKTTNQAYVVAYISPTDILQLAEDKRLKDKLGNPLLSLKAQAIEVDDIKQFIHLSGTYDYIKGRLIKT